MWVLIVVLGIDVRVRVRRTPYALYDYIFTYMYPMLPVLCSHVGGGWNWIYSTRVCL